MKTGKKLFKLSRSQWISVAVLASSLGLAVAMTAIPPFTSGSQISSSQMNTNFGNVVAAVTAVETGLTAAQGQITALQAEAAHTLSATTVTCSINTGNTVFMCSPLRLTGLAAGQRVFATSWQQVGTSAANVCPLGVAMCFQQITTPASPVTLMANQPPGFPCLATPQVGGWVHVNLSGQHTFAVAGDYDVGACAFFVGAPSVATANNGHTTAMVFAP